MKLNKLYLAYGIALLVLGLTGYLLTHAKSALISGAASAVIMASLSFVVLKNTVFLWVTRGLNALLLGVFVWRSSLAISALTAGAAEKLIPSVLLSLMALVSVVVLAVSLLKPEGEEETEED